jgi:hypothetical protein
MSPRDRTLQELANEAGFGVSGLASLIGVHRSTVQRHWVSTNWYERFTPRSLGKIMSLIPGADQAVRISALRTRRLEITDRLEALGVAVDQGFFDAANADPEIEPEFLLTALDAARFIMSENKKKAVQCLQALWGRAQTHALDAVFGTHPKYRILQDPGPLVGAAHATLIALKSDGSTSARAIAEAQLGHHIGKAESQLVITGLEEPDRGPAKSPRVQQRSAFFHRGSVMGVLRAEDDPDIAFEYERLVDRYPIAKTVETWAFPSWSGDIYGREEFSVPKTLNLSRTATEVIREIDTYNDAYVLYLVTTFIPLAIGELDARFGDRLPDLRSALLRRAEKTNLKELKDAVEKLANTIPASSC